MTSNLVDYCQLVEKLIIKTSFDVENFNTFVIKHLSLKSEDECYRTIQGRPVPLIIIHALISLRAPANDVAVRTQIIGN